MSVEPQHRSLDRPGRAWVVDPVVERSEAWAQALSPLSVEVFDALPSASAPLPDVVLWLITDGADCGLDGCRALRSDPRTATLPIVLVGSRPDDRRAVALAAGANDLVELPLVPEVVRSRIGTLVALQRQAALLERIGTLDPCTGAFNAAAFHDALDRSWRASLRAGQPVGLMLLRPEGATPSRLLEVTTALRKVARRPLDVIGRISSDTLGVLLPDTAVDGVVLVAERARGILVAHPALGPLAVGSAACFPGKRNGVDDLVRRSEQALAQALAHGGDMTWLDPADPTIRPAVRSYGTGG